MRTPGEIADSIDTNEYSSARSIAMHAAREMRRDVVWRCIELTCFYCEQRHPITKHPRTGDFWHQPSVLGYAKCEASAIRREFHLNADVPRLAPTTSLDDAALVSEPGREQG